jgi:cupin 2 domain-containing protein
MTEGNLFADLPGARLEEERLSEILARPRLRIERIVSTGQASPPGFWYDQPWDEWVALLAGAARLRFENEAQARGLSAGDYVLIPAHARHRVDWTSENPPALWLAVHFEPGAEERS